MNINRSYNLLRAEGVLSCIVLSMPVMATFYRDDLGMSQTLVGLSQAIFMASVLALDIPMGWLADRFSRKWANAIGDATTATGFVLYGFSQNFAGVVIAEIILGIGIALTNGADAPLLQSYCKELGKDFRHEMARLNSWKPLGEATGMIVGGIIGAFSLRAALFATAIPFVLGCIFSMRLIESGERRSNGHHNPFTDMWRISKYALHGHTELAWTIFARVATAELTHAVIWIFTPMLLLVGVPASLVGLAWAINLMAMYLGSIAAKRYAVHMSTRHVFGTAMVLGVLAITIMGISLTPLTIGLFAITGWVRGWSTAGLGPRVTELAPPDMSSTISSVASSASRVVYIPLVWVINQRAESSFSNALLLNALLFGMATLLIYPKLKRKE